MPTATTRDLRTHFPRVRRQLEEEGEVVVDVLHVATAVTLGMKQFVTYDERQGALAKVAGMKVLTP